MKIDNLQKILESGIKKGVKSIFFFPDFPPLGNKGGIIKLGVNPITKNDIGDILNLTLTKWQYEELLNEKELDYSYEIETRVRFRIAAFYKMGAIGLVARAIPSVVPSFDSLGLPDMLKGFTKLKDGIVLITGPTGSGKSTTLASIIDIINENYSYHILTVEDPIEFIYKNKRSIISQREVGKDTKSYDEALRRILREDPDIILIGEIRDKDSMTSAIELAETGHLVFSTLHTINVVQTINRIIDFFPEHEKQQVRKQISQILQGVVSQRLFKRRDRDGFICACEVLKLNHSVRNLIKDDKVHQIYSMMDSLKKDGAVSIDDSMIELYKNGSISYFDLANNITDKKKIDGSIIGDVVTKGGEQPIYGTGIVDIDKKVVIYRADFESFNISYFDASGDIFDTPDGILFRDKGQSKGDFHFLGDYTILNGKKQQFSLNFFFNFSYSIINVKEVKPVYRFQARIMESAKNSFNLPNIPYEIVYDGEWHTVAIPIPKIYYGKPVRYYLMFFDKDISEIIFNNIFFS